MTIVIRTHDDVYIKYNRLQRYSIADQYADSDWFDR